MAEDLWNDVAEAYDRSFASLCAGSVPALLERLPRGAAVLDVGCGSGQVAAALVSAGHHVTAVDPDPQMVALTRSRADVESLEGGLPDLPLAAASSDVAVANFVLNHVDDPRAAAAGVRRVLRPGGRLLATVWPGYPPPQAALWSAALDAAGAQRPHLPRLAPELDFERTPAGFASMLTDAGFARVEATSYSWRWSVTPEDLWAGMTHVGNFGVTWRAQDDATRSRIRAAYDDSLGPWLDDDVLAFGVECVLADAVAPDG